jgi:transcriptional regulator with GAF, ATPase, and Fis domain
MSRRVLNYREFATAQRTTSILCNSDTFSIGAAWGSIPKSPSPDASLLRALQGQEKEIIEAALAECSRGTIAGKNGATAKLGIAPSTLESKIKRLNIAKDRFASN